MPEVPVDWDELYEARRAAKARKLERKQRAGLKRTQEVAREDEKASATKFRQAIQLSRKSNQK